MPNVAEDLLRPAERDPSRIAIRYRADAERQDVSYGELAASAQRFAGLLRDLGLSREDRVLLALPDRPELLVSFLGATWAGLVPVLVSSFLRPDDLAFHVDDCGARLVVTTKAIAEALDGRTGTQPPVLTVEPGLGGTFWLSTKDAQPVASAAAVRPEDPAFWLYSSGTTGRPKGTVHCHRDIPFAVETYGRHVLDAGPRDVSYATSKAFFAYGLGASVYFPLAAGATVVLSPEPFDPARSWRLVAEERPTLFFSVPSAYRALLDTAPPDAQRATEGIRRCLSAGEGLPPSIFERWKAATGHEILDGIGSTEMLHIYLSNVPGDAAPGTVGRVVPGYEVKIVDDDGAEVGAGEEGVMWIKGASRATGYWRRPEATEAAFRGEWYVSGDRGVRDSGGRYRVLGRSDDLMKVSGQWVAPGDVEEILLREPGVRECAVIGRVRPDGLSGLVAFVVPGEAEASELVERLRARCASELPRFKRPAEFLTIDALPRTTTGKLQRFRLREALGDGA